ncbi:MAG: lipoprotein-releasing ABC transporter ATP-binding protein LolD [Pseudomonadales bacterium]|jgi:lipoprotein-releasing system ATP-binding protein|tara:strand:- start:11119 stop:11802 length:684 start_codon:yes stop_codon:yes gene_type:complete
MNDPVIKISNLHKRYLQGSNAIHILRGIDVDIERGERVAITGLSGSGKSTLLHLLGGLDTPDEGTIAINGKNINELGEAEQCALRNSALGFVYQFHHLLSEFSAEENVAMPLLIGGEKKAAAMKMARDMLASVGLTQRAEHKPSQLSGGERQRVAIARALVTRPQCVLADEPTGNLDEETAEQVNELMVGLSTALNISFVIVTHNLDLAARMDRQYRLHNGLLEAVE